MPISGVQRIYIDGKIKYCPTEFTFIMSMIFILYCIWFHYFRQLDASDFGQDTQKPSAFDMTCLYYLSLIAALFVQMHVSLKSPLLHRKILLLCFYTELKLLQLLYDLEI